MNTLIMLAIETSQHVGGVALRDARGEVHTEMLQARKRHDDDLLPAIDRLMKRVNMRPRDLASGGEGAVAVSIGPGGFSGLRIAVSTAKMLAETLGVKLVAAPSALIAAESFTGAGGRRIMVALASKGETFWATRLERSKDAWSVVAEPGIVDADALDLTAIDALLGDMHLSAAVRERCFHARVPVVEPVFDPRACLAVGERMLVAGRTVDPLAIVPLYPRKPEAVSIWEARRRT